MPKLYKYRKKGDMFLALQQDGDSIDLNIVDGDGEVVMGGHVLIITDDGRVIRCCHVNSDAAARAGLKLDDNGKIKTSGGA